MDDPVFETALGIACLFAESRGMHPRFAAREAVRLAANDGFTVSVKALERAIIPELARRRREDPFGGVTHWTLCGRGIKTRDFACGVKRPAWNATSTRQRQIVTCKRCLVCVARWERERGIRKVKQAPPKLRVC